MASPGNQHGADCIGALSFHMYTNNTLVLCNCRITVTMN